MISKFKFFINDALVDLDSKVSFPLTLQIDDISKPSALKSEVSKTISIPETKNNNIIFEHIFRYDRNATSGDINPSQKVPYSLYYGPELLSKGYVKLNSIGFESGIKRYEIHLFGIIGEFFNTLEQYKLNETIINCDVKNLKHTLNKDFIKENWNFNRNNIYSSSIHNTVCYIPSFIGLYNNFKSDEVLINENQSTELAYNCDEWMKVNDKKYIEFRSIKQKPGIYINKLIDGIKQTISTIKAPELNDGWPESVVSSEFNDVKNAADLVGQGWKLYSNYEGWSNLKVYNYLQNNINGIAISLPSNQTAGTNLFVGLNTQSLINLDPDTEYNLRLYYYSENLNRFDIRIFNASKIYDLSRTDIKTGFNVINLKFRTSSVLSECMNLSFGMSFKTSYATGANVISKLGLSTIRLSSRPFTSEIKPYKINSDFLTNNNIFYKNAVITGAPVQELNDNNTLDKSTVATIQSNNNTVALSTRTFGTTSRDFYLSKFKDEFDILKPDGSNYYIDPSSVTYDVGNMTFKGRLYMKMRPRNIKASNKYTISKPRELYVNWNNGDFGNGYFYIKLKDIGELGDNGILYLNFKDLGDGIKGIAVPNSNEYTMYFRYDDGVWKDYYEFEYNAGRFLNEYKESISATPQLEIGIVQERKHQWNIKVKGYKRSNLCDLDSVTLNNLNEIDYVISFENKLVQTSDISLKDLISSEYTQKDFLLEYCRLFGLYFDVNKHTNEVNIYTRNKFFENYKILDWNSKIDKSKQMTLNPIVFDKKYLDFGFKDNTDTTFTDLHKKLYDLNYGTQRVNTGYAFNEDSETVFDSTIFNPVAMVEQYVLDGRKPVTLPGFTKINGSERESVVSSMELLFNDGRTNIDRYLITDDTKDMMLKDEYFWNQSNPTLDDGIKIDNKYSIPKFSTISGSNILEIGKPRSTWFNVSDSIYDNKTIFDKFWRNYITDRYSVNTKKLTAYFMLTSYDILSFKFNNFVYYDGIYWVVQKIDYDLSTNNSSKVELISVNNIKNYTEGQNLDSLSATSELVYVKLTESVKSSTLTSFDGNTFNNENKQKRIPKDSQITIYAKPNKSLNPYLVFDGWYGYTNENPPVYKKLSSESTYTFNADTNITLTPVSVNSPHARIVINDADKDTRGNLKEFSWDASYKRKINVYPEGSEVVNVTGKPDWITLSKIRVTEYDTFIEISVSNNDTGYDREGYIKFKADGSTIEQELLVVQKPKTLDNSYVFCFTDTSNTNTNEDDYTIECLGISSNYGWGPKYVPQGTLLTFNVSYKNKPIIEGIDYYLEYFDYIEENYVRVPSNSNQYTIKNTDTQLIFKVTTI